MIVIRSLVTLVIAAAAALALKVLVAEPVRCNAMEKRVAGITTDVFLHPEHVETWRLPLIARESLQQIATCLEPCTISPRLLMLSAANYRVMHEWEDAEEDYERALTLDRRPEIYMNLGLVELEQGKREDAIRHLVMAGRSGYLFNQIELDLVREEVERRLRETKSSGDPW